MPSRRSNQQQRPHHPAARAPQSRGDADVIWLRDSELLQQLYIGSWGEGIVRRARRSGQTPHDTEGRPLPGLVALEINRNGSHFLGRNRPPNFELINRALRALSFDDPPQNRLLQNRLLCALLAYTHLAPENPFFIAIAFRYYLGAIWGPQSRALATVFVLALLEIGLESLESVGSAHRFLLLLGRLVVLAAAERHFLRSSPSTSPVLLIPSLIEMGLQLLQRRIFDSPLFVPTITLASFLGTIFMVYCFGLFYGNLIPVDSSWVRRLEDSRHRAAREMNMIFPPWLLGPWYRSLSLPALEAETMIVWLEHEIANTANIPLHFLHGHFLTPSQSQEIIGHSRPLGRGSENPNLPPPTLALASEGGAAAANAASNEGTVAAAERQQPLVSADQQPPTSPPPSSHAAGDPTRGIASDDKVVPTSTLSRGALTGHPFHFFGASVSEAAATAAPPRSDHATSSDDPPDDYSAPAAPRRTAS